MNRIDGPAWTTSSSQTKKAKPIVAGQRPSAAGYSAAAQPSTWSGRRSAAPRSWIVENGSRNCQTGPTMAQMMASPTQP